jgi:hypothetical protein
MNFISYETFPYNFKPVGGKVVYCGYIPTRNRHEGIQQTCLSIINVLAVPSCLCTNTLS